MAHLGILAACAHYPALSADPRRLAPRLRDRLAAGLGPIARVSAFAAHDGALPHSPAACDAWLVSGPVLNWEARDAALAQRLARLIAAAAGAGRPVFALWHGEHLLHAALAGHGAAPPSTPHFPNAIRNPVETFGPRDRLFRWCPVTRRVVETAAAPAAPPTAIPAGPQAVRVP